MSKHYFCLKKHFLLWDLLIYLVACCLLGEFQDGQGFRTIAQIPVVQFVLYLKGDAGMAWAVAY